MDINSILQTLGNSNIDLGALINLASTFLSGKNQNANNTLNNAPTLPPMQYLQNADTKPNENFTLGNQNNFSNSYFNMPQYDFNSSTSASRSAKPHMQKNTNSFNQNINKNYTGNFYSEQNNASMEQNYSQNTQNEQTSSHTANNLPNMLELLKLVMSLFSKQKEKSQTSVQTAQNLDSTILKLPRAK